MVLWHRVGIAPQSPDPAQAKEEKWVPSAPQESRPVPEFVFGREEMGPGDGCMLDTATFMSFTTHHNQECRVTAAEGNELLLSATDMSCI